MISGRRLDASQVEDLTAQHVASRPAALAHFRARWSASGLGELPTQIVDVDVVDQWFLATARAGLPDGRDDLPVWWDTDKYPLPNRLQLPIGAERERPMTAQYIRLADDLSAYLETLLVHELPRVYWIANTTGRKQTPDSNLPALVLGRPDAPLALWRRAYTRGLNAATNPSESRPEILWTLSRVMNEWVNNEWTHWWQKKGFSRPTEAVDASPTDRRRHQEHDRG
jgi:hypothetical protein